MDERGPHLVPMCFALDDDALVSAVNGEPKRSRDLRRLRDVRAHPVATVLADHYDGARGALGSVRVRGPARVLEAGGGGRGARAGAAGREVPPVPGRPARRAGAPGGAGGVARISGGRQGPGLTTR